MRFFLRTLYYSILITLLIFAVLIFFVKLPETQMLSASEVLDAKGKVVDKLFIENRIKVSINKIPKHLQNAVIAVEDYRFYNHFGIDPIGIIRALYMNFKAGRIVEGGSTITQQLAKNLYLSHERTLTRKIKELFLTLKLEFIYTKEEILEMYLNEIYLGHGTYGVQSASRLYFGKDVSQLNLAECALLAGIPRRPEYYSPIKNFKAAKNRQELILDKMVEYGYISPEEAEKAKKAKLVITKNLKQTQAPYFVQYVLNKISQYDENLVKKIYTGGYKIFTTLNVSLQREAETAFRNNLKTVFKDDSGIVQPQGALVAVDPSTGYIKAMIGGRNYSNTQFNRATAKRQPGSAFKPFIYAAALDKGYTTIDEFVCEPTKYPKGNGEYWIPQDYNNDYHYRLIKMREALVISDNVVSVKWLKQIGIQTAINYARKFGIKSQLTRDLTLALGTSDISPLEMAAAYCVFANGGYKVEPIALLKIVDPDGRVVFKNQISKSKVLDEKVAFILTDILKDVLKPGGTGEHLKVLGPAAGKTGTTQNNRDAWFVGYTPNLSTAVYVGYDNPKRSLWSVGGYIAGPIWRDFINKSFQVYPPEDFVKPPGVVTYKICSETNNIANATCPVYEEIFIEGTQPKEKCSVIHWNSFFEFPPKQNPVDDKPEESSSPNEDTKQTPQKEDNNIELQKQNKKEENNNLLDQIENFFNQEKKAGN